MTSMKKLNTYSKTQKVINYSSLFSNVLGNFGSASSEKAAANATLNKSDSIIETINVNKRKLSQHHLVSDVNVVATKRGRKKKQTVENNKENDQVFSNKMSSNATSDNAPPIKNTKKKAKEKRPEVKQIILFEDSDSNSNTCNLQLTDNQNRMSLSENISIVNNASKNKLRSTKINESSFRNSKLSNRSASPSATAIVNSAISCIDAYDFLQNEKPAKSKSIIKDSRNSKNENIAEANPEKEPKVATSNPPKRSVRIIEDINLKNDKLESIKCDNKHKHTAATSTPSGLRRRPLKLPQNVSIISKS